jgi:hypothetical protein
MTMKIYDLSEEKFSFMDMASHFVGRARGTLPFSLSRTKGVRQIRAKLVFQSHMHTRAAERLCD